MPFYAAPVADYRTVPALWDAEATRLLRELSVVAGLTVRHGMGCPGFGRVQEGQEVDPGHAPPAGRWIDTSGPNNSAEGVWAED